MRENLPYKLVYLKPLVIQFLPAAKSNIHPFNETLMDPIQEWSQLTHCGIRTSFDTWRFKNKKELTMFLLRWGS
jgi:hypothetical protein